MWFTGKIQMLSGHEKNSYVVTYCSITVQKGRILQPKTQAELLGVKYRIISAESWPELQNLQICEVFSA